jgi:DUF1365 family protein
MAYLDLQEAAEAVARSRVLGSARWSPVAFRAEDHEAASLEGLRAQIADRLAALPLAAAGPVRLLTQLRHFGYYFSPLNLFYCFDAAGSEIASVVAEVSNTPWREKHWYVLQPTPRGERGPDCRLADSHEKRFHVSPFMEMDLCYDWLLSAPGPTTAVSIAVRRPAGPPFFIADFHLQRYPLTDGELLRCLLRHPFMTGQIMAAIHWQAFKLWMKRCPYFPHPGKRATDVRRGRV